LSGAAAAPCGLVVEGVTGAGKTQTLRALMARTAMREAVLVPEEETLGEFMDEELGDPAMAPAAKLWRLRRVLERVRGAEAGVRFLIERFHPTYYALLGDWALVAPIDDELAARGFRLVVLTVGDGALTERALHRVDRAGTAWASEMVAAFGSEAAAVAAIRASQARRVEALARTRLPWLRIDTSAMEWEGYAGEIDAFLTRP
jgi:hypothetical protein